MGTAEVPFGTLGWCRWYVGRTLLTDDAVSARNRYGVRRKQVEFIKQRAWIGAIIFGLVLAGAGAFMVREGRLAHNDVEDTLAAERIVSSEDADIPLTAVTGPAEAEAQANAIKTHMLKITNGKTYAELDRNDPNRAQYLNSVTLRTALMESYMAFKIADLVSGVGLIVIALGGSQVVLGVYLGFVARPARAPAERRASIIIPGGI